MANYKNATLINVALGKIPTSIAHLRVAIHFHCLVSSPTIWDIKDLTIMCRTCPCFCWNASSTVLGARTPIGGIKPCCKNNIYSIRHFLICYIIQYWGPSTRTSMCIAVALRHFFPISTATNTNRSLGRHTDPGPVSGSNATLCSAQSPGGPGGPIFGIGGDLDHCLCYT